MTTEAKPTPAPISTEPAPAPVVEAKAEPKVEVKAESLLNKDAKAASGAPEKYEAFKLPEGVTLDPKVNEEATALFKANGLSQAQAQSLIDFHVAKAQAAAQRPYDAYAEMRQGWQTEVKADKEIGGILPQVKETVSRALDSLGDPKLATDFRAAMDLTGAGDHPAFIKAFYKLAQRVTEGTAVRGAGPAAVGQRSPNAGPISAAKALYPNNP